MTPNNKKEPDTKPEDKPDVKPDVKNVPPEKPSKEEETLAIENIDPKEFLKDKTIILKELPKGVGIPKFFVKPDSDPLIRKVEEDEAVLFLTGPYNIGTDKKPVFASFSARVTWLGLARRFISKQVMVGTEGTSPNKNFWKIWTNGCRFWRDQEYIGLIKDPAFITQCFASKNWKIRFILDKVISAKKAEGRLKSHNVQQWLGRPYRLREGAILLGQEVPLNPGEADIILKKIKSKTIKLKKEFSYITKYLEARKKSDIERTVEMARLAAEKAKEE